MSFKRELHPDPGSQLQPVININPEHQASMPAPWLKKIFSYYSRFDQSPRPGRVDGLRRVPDPWIASLDLVRNAGQGFIGCCALKAVLKVCGSAYRVYFNSIWLTTPFDEIIPDL